MASSSMTRSYFSVILSSVAVIGFSYESFQFHRTLERKGFIDSSAIEFF